MTIEEEFFKAFGIERSLKNWKMRADFLNVNKEAVASAVYPEITAEKLLELICIMSKYKYVLENLYVENINTLKDFILSTYIGQRLDEDKETLQQVKALFEDKENV